MRRTRKSASRFVSVAAVLALTAVGRAHGVGYAPAPPPVHAVLQVPTVQFPTLQSAVDAATQYDVVDVGDRTPAEHVVVDGKSNLTITGPGVSLSQITGVADGAVLEICNSTNVTIAFLDLRGGTHGVEVHDAGVTLKDVWVSQSSGDGIVADGSSTNLLVNGGDVAAVPGAAVRLDGVSSASISSLHVEGVGGDGIVANGGTIFIGGVTMSVLGGSGVRVADAARVTVSSSILNGASAPKADGTTDPAPGDGVVATGLSVSVFANQVQGFAGRGVVAVANAALSDENSFFGAGSVASSNVVSGVGGDAVTAGDGVHADSNAITGVGGDGVVCKGVGACASGNIVRQVLGNGVRVASGASENVVSGNTVAHAGQAGVLVEAAGAHVAQNTVTSPGSAGVTVRADGAAVADNTIDDPTTDGVDLGGSKKALVSGNTVFAARGCGFRVDAAAAANSFKGNTATNCAEWGLWESDAAGKNSYAKSNRFGKAHLRRKHR